MSERWSSGWSEQFENGQGGIGSSGTQPSATILSMEVVDPRASRIRRNRGIGLVLLVALLVGVGATLSLQRLGNTEDVASTDVSASPAVDPDAVSTDDAAQLELPPVLPPQAQPPAAPPVTEPPPVFLPSASDAGAEGVIPTAPNAVPGPSGGDYQAPPSEAPSATIPAYQPPALPVPTMPQAPPVTAPPIADEQAVADCIAAATQVRDSDLRSIRSERYRVISDASAQGNFSAFTSIRLKELDDQAAAVEAQFDADVAFCEAL